MNKKQKKLQSLQNDYDICEHQLEIAQDNLDRFINGDLYHPLGQEHLQAVRNKWRGELVKIKEQMMELDESLRPPRLPSDSAEKIVCPKCKKEFIELHKVYGDPEMPFTANAYDWKNALFAFGAFSVEKEIICHQDGYLHFRFLYDGEERLVLSLGNPDLKQLAKTRKHHQSLHKTCEHEDEDENKNCQNDGEPYYLNPLDSEPNGYYCTEHAGDEGFCYGCGQFLAGTEGFDFSPVKGLCPSCLEELRIETGEYDEYDDGDWDYNPCNLVEIDYGKINIRT